MSIEHTQSYSIASDSGGTAVTGSQAEVGATEIVIDQRFGASLTDQLLAMSFTVANVQSVFLVSDKGLKIETNSGGSPVDTINLKPGTPLVWSKSAAYYANPFGTNVTAFYITTTVASRLQGKILTV